MTGESAGLLALLASAFTSATLLPGTSEAVLAGMVAGGVAPVVLLITVATIGNVAGSCINWAMGRAGRSLVAGEHPSPAMEKATRWYQRFGRWSLLAAWVPVIGDPLTLVAGALGEPLWRFLAIVALAKAARYVAVAVTAAALL